METEGNTHASIKEQDTERFKSDGKNAARYPKIANSDSIDMLIR